MRIIGSLNLWKLPLLRHFSQNLYQNFKSNKKFLGLNKNGSSYEILISFDVVGYFTSVPVDKTTGLVLELLSYESLSSRTSLHISDIKRSLEPCLYSTIFSYINFLYQQTSGTLIYELLHFSSHCQHIPGTHWTQGHHYVSLPTFLVVEICWQHVLHSQQTAY